MPESEVLMRLIRKMFDGRLDLEYVTDHPTGPFIANGANPNSPTLGVTPAEARALAMILDGA